MHSNMGDFAFTLGWQDGEVLGKEAARLVDVGVVDGSMLMLYMQQTRDYAKIKQFERVLKTPKHPQGILVNDRGELFVCHYYGSVNIHGSLS